MLLPRSCKCGRVVPHGQRCPYCTRQTEQRRGTTRQRFGPNWNRISQEVIERDHGICWLCRQPGADTTHHLQARNGMYQQRATDKRMLVAAHRACNAEVGNRTG